LNDRIKHVEIDRFFIKEKSDDGTLDLNHVNSRGQIADCLTKGFGVNECQMLYNKMWMINIYRPS
jgi:hypothetical protein